jgi:hypothetical protein
MDTPDPNNGADSAAASDAKPADPSPTLAAAVGGTLEDAAREKAARDAAAMNMMRAAQMEGARAAQRLSVATALCSGMCAGFYSNPDAFVAGFGDTLVDKSYEWADQLIARAMKPPKAANDT